MPNTCRTIAAPAADPQTGPALPVTYATTPGWRISLSAATRSR
jgi:hypothetical protein